LTPTWQTPLNTRQKRDGTTATLSNDGFTYEGATMARQGDKLASALEAEARAHQRLVNIGEELRTVQKARQKPDDDEMLRFDQAYAALLLAAMSVHAAVRSKQLASSD
jgi:hypothetical protein